MIENPSITDETSSKFIADYSDFAPVLLDIYNAIIQAKKKHQNNQADLAAELLHIKSELENKSNSIDESNPGILASKNLITVHAILVNLDNAGATQNFSHTLTSLVEACNAFDALNNNLDSKSKLYDEIRIAELMHTLAVWIDKYADITKLLGIKDGAQQINAFFEHKNSDGLIVLLVDATVLRVKQSFDIMQANVPVIFSGKASEESMQKPFVARSKTKHNKSQARTMTDSKLTLMLDNLLVLNVLQRLCSNKGESVNIKLHNVMDLSFAIYIKYIPQLDASGLIALNHKVADFANQINNNTYIFDNSKNILNRIKSRYTELTGHDIPVIPRDPAPTKPINL